MTLRPGHIVTQKPVIGEIQSLTRVDLGLLTEKRPEARLKNISDGHHRIARAFAAGLSNQEIAALTGRSINRIAILRHDPTMIELTAHYRSLGTVEYAETMDVVTEYLGTIRTKALAMIEDKIDAASDNGEFLPSRDLAAFAELGLDRTGYGKRTTNVNVNIDFASRIETMRRRSAQSRTIEGVAVTPRPQSPPGVETPSPPAQRLRRF